MVRSETDYWLEKIHEQCDEILKQIEEINKKLKEAQPCANHKS